MTRILHLDMDAFFASVEQLDDPSLRGLPVIVGKGDRGVVSAASYEARAYGVRSAMPVAHARRLCPQGVFVAGRMRRYAEISRQVMAVLGEFSPLVEQASVDEAYMDVTGADRLFGPPAELARKLQARVREAVGLSCSVGVAPVKFLAKIASDYRKPGGVTIIEPHEVEAFLRDLPVGKIPGVGGKTLPRLASLGVKTCGDVLRYSAEFWEARLGEWGLALHARAGGRGSTHIVTDSEPKSSSAENTFEKDLSDPEALKRWLLRQSERVGRDLRKHGLAGRTVTLKIKFSDFKQITRSHTLAEPTDTDEEIFATACRLLDQERLAKAVRLIGVGVSNFARGPRQLALVEDRAKVRASRLDRAVDAIRDKHGKAAVKRGRLFEE
ncbi:DNA polymerase IV [Fundidesulfovibrio magnetotacticus]|uniref:DNA polymerase IV n=1 Tax=Fundidesulfovibrio magnetotacticus TaxID=2730080 RepID=UPI001566DDE8|nr:DNA polymerase IV [Fundidesulfovibrio magnetotacticus]